MEEERESEIKQGQSIAQRMDPSRFGWTNYRYYIKLQTLRPGNNGFILGDGVEESSEKGDVVIDGK